MTTFDPNKITFFAKTDARGKEAVFGIKAMDRQRHMYVVGKTGMGKSTLLENMAAQDIMNGEGMAFIDPHGSAAETLLEYVPEHRINDVVYFAPFDLEHPVSFNVMEDVGPDKRHLVVSGLMSTFKKIWVDAWSARMEYILTNALLVLIEYPDSTLLSVNRLFSDKAYRKKVVEACQDPAVKSFWVDEYANYTERFTADALPAIQNKIGQFTGNPLIRNIIGQPHSSFDIRKLMDEKKIIIMNLSKGLIGETNANLLGSMLTTRIYLAAMSRADLPVEQMKKMPNFYFYVDEFQSFANATFANILSEARKYHLNLIIAHQYIAQMEEEVRDAVFGNVGTTVAFRVGPFDAEVLETVFTPRFLAADLVNLGFAQIYLTLMIEGIGSQPFSAVTLPPIERPPVSCRNMVVTASRKLYANKRSEIEKIVADLHTPQVPEKTHKPADRGKQGYQGGQGQGGNSKPAAYGNRDNNKPNSGERFPRNEYKKPAPTEDAPRKEYTRPKPVEKTPEDLKSVLSKMAEKNAPEKPESKPETKVEAVESKPETKPKVEVPEVRPEPKQVNEQNIKENPRKFNNDWKDRKNNNQTNKGREQQENKLRELKPDLKQGLRDALKNIEANHQTNATEQNQTEAKSPAQPPAQPPAQQAPKTYSSTEQSPIEARRQRPVPDFNSTPKDQKVVIQEPVSEGIDPAKIKRMLRQSDNERSPFN